MIMTNSNNEDILLSIQNLSAVYGTRLGDVKALSNINLDIFRGEIIGLVGESGCGKSTLGRAIMRMLGDSGRFLNGELLLDGVDLLKLSDGEMREIRGQRISMIFQDPMTSLNPVQRVDDHFIETIKTHEPNTNRKDAVERFRNLLERLGIQKEREVDYPHQLSGGMRQRVMIGLGMVLNANLIIADEATTSLDVIVEAKLVDELQAICKEFGVSILAITHNIALIAQISERLAVMYAGNIVEVGSVYDVFDDPKHPYTQGLLQSVPTIKLDDREELYKMPGEPPNLTEPPPGCRFHPRCPHAMEICTHTAPDTGEIDTGHFVSCWLYQEIPDNQDAAIQVKT